jgi:hypothetical protein
MLELYFFELKPQKEKYLSIHALDYLIFIEILANFLTNENFATNFRCKATFIN